MSPPAGSDGNENPRDWVEAGAGGIEAGQAKASMPLGFRARFLQSLQVAESNRRSRSACPANLRSVWAPHLHFIVSDAKIAREMLVWKPRSTLGPVEFVLWLHAVKNTAKVE